jgi:hypothetical protein
MRRMLLVLVGISACGGSTPTATPQTIYVLPDAAPLEPDMAPLEPDALAPLTPDAGAPRPDKPPAKADAAACLAPGASGCELSACCPGSTCVGFGAQRLCTTSCSRNEDCSSRCCARLGLGNFCAPASSCAAPPPQDAAPLPPEPDAEEPLPDLPPPPAPDGVYTARVTRIALNHYQAFDTTPNLLITTEACSSGTNNAPTNAIIRWQIFSLDSSIEFSFPHTFCRVVTVVLVP